MRIPAEGAKSDILMMYYQSKMAMEALEGSLKRYFKLVEMEKTDNQILDPEIKVQKIIRLLNEGVVIDTIANAINVTPSYVRGVNDLWDYVSNECPEGGCLVNFNTYGED